MKTTAQVVTIWRNRAQALIDAGVPLTSVAHTLTLASGCRDRFSVRGSHVVTRRGFSVITGERVSLAIAQEK